MAKKRESELAITDKKNSIQHAMQTILSSRIWTPMPSMITEVINCMLRICDIIDLMRY